MKDWLKRSALATGVALSAVILIGGRSADAQVLPSSDITAGYLVFPKVVVDVTADPAFPNRTDTFIQLTNTSRAAARVVQCFYIDSADWTEHNFTLQLTPGQPAAWSVRDGTKSTNPIGLIAGRGDHFLGELKCVEVDQFSVPVPIRVNDLKGEATIYTVRVGSVGSQGSVDVRSYNAIGFQAVNVSTDPIPVSIGRQCEGGTNPGATCTSDANCTGTGQCGVTMCLGSIANSPECATQDYVACPATLILNNFFEDALDPVNGNPISTNVTFVPCTEDIINQGADAQPVTRIQFLIFNEFEQRMSTAAILQCYKDTPLWGIDAKSSKASVFNVGVQGTLVGQTRMRSVQVPTDTTVGHGILAIAEEHHGPDASVAVNLNESGVNSNKADFVRYIVAQ